MTPPSRNMESLRHWLRLYAIKGIGPATASELIQLGDLSELFARSKDELVALGCSARLAQLLIESEEPDGESVYRWLQANASRHILTLDNPDYPRLLQQSGGAPPMLYCQGNIDLLHTPQLAIVGSRNPSAQGKKLARAFARVLSDAGLTITSGMALGVDGLAHEAALERGGNTLAVVGTGLNHIYPARNKSLAEAILASGLMVSEFPLDLGVRGENFPRRNRIISGLSLGVLVVEAAVQSGSLITAHYAMEQGREVFAIPGSIHNPLAKGCHVLIKQGAQLVETAEEILTALNFLAKAQVELNWSELDSIESESAGSIDPDLQRLLRQIDFSPTSLDELVERCKKPVAELSPNLLTLELDGWITQTAGGYQRQK